MKKIFIILLTLTVLIGCQGQPEDIVEPTVTEPQETPKEAEPEVPEASGQETQEEQQEEEAVNEQESVAQNETESLETNESVAQTKVIEIKNEGFDPTTVMISVGDTVLFKNVRTELTGVDALIIGLRDCKAMKSKVFEPGEEYSYTFDEPVVCTYIDGVRTTQSGKIYVE